MKPLFRWMLNAGFLALLIAATFLMHRVIVKQRISLLISRIQLEQTATQLVQAASVELDLEKHAADIARIEKLVPPREEIESFVSSVDAEAQRRNVSLNIPKVEERITYDDAGKPIVPTGPIEYVEVDLVAGGEPVDLLQFLHFVETVPYVLELESWNIATESNKTLERTGQLAPGSEPILSSATGYLEASLVIGVINEQP